MEQIPRPRSRAPRAAAAAPTRTAPRARRPCHPHAIRHATVFGALGAIKPGQSMVLVAPHDPKPLLAQIADREQGTISVTYLDEGPEAWRLRLTRA